MDGIVAVATSKSQRHPGNAKEFLAHHIGGVRGGRNLHAFSVRASDESGKHEENLCGFSVSFESSWFKMFGWVG
jgi:hypothetical protein